jgi:glucose-1-phosphate cytidylyltransferase|tara:strand:- start:2595 stop:3380 length:786 start_codon:yes stop_codon:yes gene_type:complete
MKFKNRSAVILCGGKGTRLGVIGKKIPKTLVKIQGREILWYIVKMLKLYNFNHFVIPLGFKGNLIKKFFKKNKNFNCKIELINTGVNSGIGRRIFLAEKEIKSENFLLLNGDAIFDFNIDKIFKNHEKNNFGISFISGEITYQYGTVGTIKNKVVDFKRNLVYEAIKTRNSNTYKAFNYTGMSIINTHLIRKHKKICNKTDNFEQDIFPKLLKKSSSNLQKIKGYWHSIDNVKDIKVVNEIKIKDKRFLGIKKIKKKLNGK